jgi:hypothetical protein
VTDEELRQLVASLVAAQKETDRQLKDSDRQMAEFRRTQEEANKELRKQLGGLGNKFGDFAEGMAIPSLIEILAKRFGADQIVETKRMRKGEDEIELDLIGASNGATHAVVAAEVKSALNQRELDRFVRNLRRFFQFFPQFRGYKLYGVLAPIDSSKEMDAATLAQGICLARMHGDVFRLTVPPNFQPKDFSETQGAA